MMGNQFTSETREMVIMSARLSRSVYDDFSNVSFSDYCGKIDAVEFWVTGDAEGMGVVIGDVAYAVFRGTETNKLADWWADAKAAPSHFGPFGKDALVHRGFYAYALALEDQFLAFAEKHSGKRLVLTGHSLGGAMALISAGLSPRPVYRVITFGGPAVGDSDFVRAIEEKVDFIMRFENNNDAVSAIPALLPWLDHAGNRYYLPRFGQSVWINPARWRYHADRLAGRILCFNLLDGLKDHPMAKYVKRIQRVLLRCGNQE